MNNIIFSFEKLDFALRLIAPVAQGRTAAIPKLLNTDGSQRHAPAAAVPRVLPIGKSKLLHFPSSQNGNPIHGKSMKYTVANFGRSSKVADENCAGLVFWLRCAGGWITICRVQDTPFGGVLRKTADVKPWTSPAVAALPSSPLKQGAKNG